MLISNVIYLQLSVLVLFPSTSLSALHKSVVLLNWRCSGLILKLSYAV